VHCQSFLVDETGQVTGLTFKGEDNAAAQRWARNHSSSGQLECRERMVRYCTIPNVSAVLMRRGEYINCGMAEETFRQCGDWYLYVRLLVKCHLTYIAQPLNYHRRHPQAQTKQFSGSLLWFTEELQVVDFILQNMSVSDVVKADVFRALTERLCQLGVKVLDAGGLVGVSVATRQILERSVGLYAESHGDRWYWANQVANAKRAYLAALRKGNHRPFLLAKLLLLHLGELGRWIRLQASPKDLPSPPHN
jgi:hypothetical protein